MDPLERTNPDTDTTYALMRSAQKAGHRSYVADARDLSLLGGVPHVTARAATIPGRAAHFDWSEEARFRRVDDFPVAWLRTDPPFDLTYVEATWILDAVDRRRTLLVNDPAGVRGANE